MRLTLAILLLPLAALGQSFTVLVNSNGVIRYPTNLFAANSNSLVAVTGTGGGGGSVASTDITDSTAAGRALLTAVDAAAQRTALALGTAATNNVPASGNAASGEVVKGNDTRLTDSRTPTSHTHPASEISDSTAAGRALLTAADAAAQRTALSLGTSALLNVASSGDAASGEVVKGNDGRLTDSRTPTSHSHDAGAITSGVFDLGRLATGTPHASNFLRGDGAFAQVTTNDVPGLVAALAAGGGGTKTLASFRAQQGEPPASNYPYLTTVNGMPVKSYDHTTQQADRFRWCVPEGFSGTVADVIVSWTTTATSGDVRWGARHMRLTGVVTSDSFGTAVEGATTTSGTGGTMMTTTLEDVDLDGAVAGNWVVTEIYRDADHVGDTVDAAVASQHGVEVRAP